MKREKMDDIKHAIDMISFGATMAALIGLIPAITSVASLIWVCIRIYETKTVQRWLRGNSYDRRDGERRDKNDLL